jgi:putative NIF3 family GTP cyclohydrolase 1 type 2
MPIAGTYKGNLDDQKVFSKIGVSGGSGGKMVSDAVRLGLDLFISAEFSFHDELLAADYGLTLLDLGHDASERPVLEPLSKLIRDRFPDTSVTIETR